MFGKKTNPTTTAYREAKAELAAEYERILATDPERNETPVWQAANARVAETEKSVPWYRQ